MARYDWTESMLAGARKQSGASAKTAKQDGLRLGRLASETMAETDSKIMEKKLGQIVAVADAASMPPALICAIISRESRAGSVLDADGWGDRGNAFGVMQVDKRFHEIKGVPDPWSQEHLFQGCDILTDYLDRVIKKFSGWPGWAKMKGSIVAYNAGVGNVRTIDRMDKGTTGDDYGSDTLTRAAWFHKEFFM